MTDIDKLDPTTKDKIELVKVNNDVAIIVIVAMTPEHNDALLGLIARSANVENVVKVPLKIQLKGTLHRVSQWEKVHLPTLEAGISRIPGVSLKTS